MRTVRQNLPAGSCLYQATDSLILTQAGFESLEDAGLIDADQLGSFRLIDVYEDGEIVTSNHYRLGEHWVRGGAWGRARQLKSGRWAFSQWQSADSIIDHYRGPLVTVTEHELNPPTRYRKGQISAGGWVSFPVLSDFKDRF